MSRWKKPFGKGGSEPDAATVAPDGGESTDKPKAKSKKRNHMSQVIAASVPATSGAVMAENKPFLLDGGSKALVLVLKVAAIGGLSSATKRDQSKGAFLRQMEATHIQAYVPEPLREAEQIALIPTKETLSEMDEFTMLVQARYSWGVADLRDESIPVTLLGTDENGEPGDNTASWSQAHNIAEGKESATDVYAQYVGDAASGSAPVLDDADEDEEMDEYIDDEAFEGSVDPDDGPATVAMSAVDLDDDDVDPNEVGSADIADGDDDPNYPDEDEEPSDYPDEDDEHLDEPDDDEDDLDDEPAAEPIDDRVITEAELDDTIVRRFSDTDLGLVVDTEPYERIIANEQPLPLIEIPDQISEWLGGQAEQLRDLANNELTALRQASIDTGRRNFVAWMSTHAEKIANETDPFNASTTFGELMEDARDLKSTRENDRNKIVEERRKELDEAYAAERQVKMDAAANAAGERYDERHGRAHKAAREALVTTLQLADEATYNETTAKILDARRDFAARQMDLGISAALEKLSEMREADRAAELEVLGRWQDAIWDLVTEQREKDDARINTLRDELKHNTDIKRLQEENSAAIAKINAQHESTLSTTIEDYDRKLSELRADLDEARKAHEADLAAREDSHRVALSSQSEATSAALQRAEKAEATIRDYDSIKETEVKSRTSDLEARMERDRASFDRELSNSRRMQWVVCLVMGALMLLVALACFTLGRLNAAPAAPAAGVQPIPTVTVTSAPQTQQSAPQTQSGSQTPLPTITVTQQAPAR